MVFKNTNSLTNICLGSLFVSISLTFLGGRIGVYEVSVLIIRIAKPQLVIHRTKFQWLWIREGEVSLVVDSEGKVRELWVSKRRKIYPLQKSHVPEYVFLSDHNFSYCNM
jgi:hypothetical protein